MIEYKSETLLYEKTVIVIDINTNEIAIVKEDNLSDIKIAKLVRNLTLNRFQHRNAYYTIWLCFVEWTIDLKVDKAVIREICKWIFIRHKTYIIH